MDVYARPHARARARAHICFHVCKRAHMCKGFGRNGPHHCVRTVRQVRGAVAPVAVVRRDVAAGVVRRNLDLESRMSFDGGGDDQMRAPVHRCAHFDPHPLTMLYKSRPALSKIVAMRCRGAAGLSSDPSQLITHKVLQFAEQF